VAASSGLRHITFSTAGQKRQPLHGAGNQGPAQLVTTKGYSGTQAMSVVNNLQVTAHLRQGDGLASRRSERVFGEGGSGRLKLGSAGTKIEKLGADYVPAEETCVKAAVRSLVARGMVQGDAP